MDGLDDNTREKIFNLFFSLPNCRIILIIRLKPCTKKNSTYMKVSRINSTYKDIRLTRQFGSCTLVQNTLPTFSQLKGKTPHRRGERESGHKRKEVIKANLGVAKIKRT